MKLFIYAMEKEAAPFLDKVLFTKKRKLGYATVYEAFKGDKSFLIAISGIGKAFAAGALSAILTAYEGQIDEIYNLGVGGSLSDKEAPVFSFVVSKAFYEHDLDTSAIGDPVGMISGINVIEIPASEELGGKVVAAVTTLGYPSYRGIISSGDTFFSDPKDYERVRNWNGATCIDMESAPFGHIAYVYDVPFVSVRCISDAGDGGEYAINLPRCCEQLCDLALALI